MKKSIPDIVHLRAGGVSFVLDATAERLPAVMHWGAELDESVGADLLATASPAVMNSSLDEPRRFSIFPTEVEGWSGSPAGQWLLDGALVHPRFNVTYITRSDDNATVAVEDADHGISLLSVFALDSSGVLSVRHTVANSGAGILTVVTLRTLLPVPARAVEILDQTGRWTQERTPQRLPIVDGTHSRQVRRGRPGHDSPLLSIIGTAGFGFRAGEVWSMHVAWSGNQEYLVERLPEGAGALSAVLGGGELLGPGEVRLAAGEQYETPELLFAWSDSGIDGLSARYHSLARRMSAHPNTPRPLVLNTWEAVYFDHDRARLSELAHTAAHIGVERFVLDDGGFRGRRSDHAGLGDWDVDKHVWPNGLAEISDVVHGLGMEFGLWFEPEMVNRDSDLVRAHPDWILGNAAEWRHQLSLDLTNPDVGDYVLERMDSVIRESGVDFVKWDHNRDLHVAVSSHGARGSVHEQTVATYRLIDDLRGRHPRLEIEACASGGGRADFGMLSRTQRLWASDTNDPLERQAIQRWTGVVFPPEIVGTHVGPAEAHTTHRVSALQFRLITALFGHAGIEWDIASCTVEERAALNRWAVLYKELRSLLHTGTTIRADELDDGALLHGVVASDRTEAVFAWIRTEPSAVAYSPRTRLPGLDPDRQYRVRVRDEIGSASTHQVSDPDWFSSTSAALGSPLSGKLLADVGVPLPVLNPAHGLLLHLTAV